MCIYIYISDCCNIFVLSAGRFSVEPIRAYFDRLPAGCQNKTLLNVAVSDRDGYEEIFFVYYTTLYYTILLCYAMLCYAMLCYAILYYTILYYTILYRRSSSSARSWSTATSRRSPSASRRPWRRRGRDMNMSYCIVLNCSVVWSSVVQCSVLYCCIV